MESRTMDCIYENQTKVYRQLRDGGFITFSQPYMTKLVKKGKIPFKEKDGRKMYCLKEVIASLKKISALKEEQSDSNNATINEAGRTLEEELKYQQARNLRQKADKFDELVLFREEAEQTMYTLFNTIKKQFQMLTTRVPMSSELKIELDNEIDSILKDLSSVDTYIGH